MAYINIVISVGLYLWVIIVFTFQIISQFIFIPKNWQQSIFRKSRFSLRLSLFPYVLHHVTISNSIYLIRLSNSEKTVRNMSNRQETGYWKKVGVDITLETRPLVPNSRQYFVHRLTKGDNWSLRIYITDSELSTGVIIMNTWLSL